MVQKRHHTRLFCTDKNERVSVLDPGLCSLEGHGSHALHHLPGSWETRPFVATQPETLEKGSPQFGEKFEPANPTGPG